MATLATKKATLVAALKDLQRVTVAFLVGSTVP